MYDFFVIGHISLDENIDLHKKEESIGGAILYSSSVYTSLGKKVAVLTKLSPSDHDCVYHLNVPERNIYISPSAKTTSIRNEYLDESREKRISTALATADPFLSSDIPEDLTVRVIHFASLIYGEYKDNLIQQLAARAKIGLDVQGFLRNVGENGKLVYQKWQRKECDIPYIHYLKTDAAEAEYLTGKDNTREAAKILHQWGARETLITHHSEVLVYDGDKFYSYPLKPGNLSGRTGRGDTCFSAYLSERLDKDPDQSLLFAVALTSIKLSNPGPFRGNRSDVERFIHDNYRS